METYLIAMTSITYANKASDLLKRKGYRCAIQKTPKNLASGCGYSIKVEGELEDIASLLTSKSIVIRDVMKFNDAG